MFSQSPLTPFAQMIASQSFLPKQMSPILAEPPSVDLSLILNEFAKNPLLFPQMNLQDVFMAQLNEFRKQLINQQIEQVMKAMNEASQKVDFKALFTMSKLNFSKIQVLESSRTWSKFLELFKYLFFF